MVELDEAQVTFPALIEAVLRGGEVVLTRHGEPVAKLTGLASSEGRELGFYPITFESDLLEPTDDEVVDAFYDG